MTNSVFPLLFFLTTVTTNWVGVGSDFKREGGTNYTRQVQLIQTNTYAIEVTLCTNRVLFRQEQSTNGPLRWQVQVLPGVPGRL